ncbi:MAG: 4Fe-4S binding protein [Desulfobacteraceae bacterium]|nr:4Fe-4S binding protein [Desulfobacteraceae bacterium]
MEQHVIPTERVMEIIGNERSFAVTDCVCRTEYKRCDNPVRVCLLLNDSADRQVKKGSADRITVGEAEVVLQKANDHGLIHLTFYEPGEKLYALCSCCSCCCHDLQLMRSTRRNDLIAQSGYVAVTSESSCTNCGRCTERCVFDARCLTDDGLQVDMEKCYGCGLCITTCPEHAIELKEKATLV